MRRTVTASLVIVAISSIGTLGCGGRSGSEEGEEGVQDDGQLSPAEEGDGEKTDSLGAPSRTERKDIVRAIHAQYLDKAVHGQRNELVISWIRAGKGTDGTDYAFVEARVQKTGGGELDWSDSDFASDVREGLFDGPQMWVLLQGEAPHPDDNRWTFLEGDIGPTDVSWDGIWDRRNGLPCEIFNGRQETCLERRAIATGTYELNTQDMSGTLVITSSSPVRFDLIVVRKTGGNSFGEIVDGVAPFTSGSDCVITMTQGEHGSESVELVQTGPCSSDFGASVDASGTYWWRQTER
jgi:hypothetical protein